MFGDVMPKNIKIYAKRIITYTLVAVTISHTGMLVSDTLDSPPEFEFASFLKDINFSNNILTFGKVCEILYKLKCNSAVPLSEEINSNSNYISWAIDNQILLNKEELNDEKSNAYNSTDTEFYNHEPINKKQLAQMLYQYISKTNCVVTEGVSAISSTDNYKDYIGWATKNRIMDISNGEELVTKEFMIEVFTNFVYLYKLNYNKEFYYNELIMTIDKNKKIPSKAKETLKIYADIIRDYNISDDKFKEIVNRLKKLKFIENESIELDDNVLGNYDYNNNTITFSHFMLTDTYQATMFHEGFHAITDNNDIVGFYSIGDKKGRGLTEGINKLIEIEYTDIEEKNGYDYTSTFAAILTQIIGPDKLINYYINSDIDGLKNNIVNIYLNKYDKDTAIQKYEDIISGLDCINFFELQNQTDKIDNKYLKEIFDLFDELLYLNNGYRIQDDKLMSAYYEKLLSQKYCYYKIEHYFFNKKFTNNPTTIIKISNDAVNKYQSINTNEEKIIPSFQMAVQEIIHYHPEYLDIIEIDNQKTR